VSLMPGQVSDGNAMYGPLGDDCEFGLVTGVDPTSEESIDVKCGRKAWSYAPTSLMITEQAVSGSAAATSAKISDGKLGGGRPGRLNSAGFNTNFPASPPPSTPTTPKFGAGQKDVASQLNKLKLKSPGGGGAMSDYERAKQMAKGGAGAGGRSPMAARAGGYKAATKKAQSSGGSTYTGGSQYTGRGTAYNTPEQHARMAAAAAKPKVKVVKADAKADAKSNAADDSLEYEVISWITSVVGVPIVGDMQNMLQSGEVLCQLINALFPGTIPKINTSRMAFKKMENIAWFLEACETKAGVASMYLFMTTDLFEGTNMKQVCLCLNALKNST